MANREMLAPLIAAALTMSAAADSYVVTLDPSARSEPATGRVILFFITKSDVNWDRTSPLEGPFYDDPQPIGSIAVTNVKPGDSVSIDGSAFAFPHSVDLLDGRIRVQAVLDVDNTERSFLDGPGNVISEAVSATVSKDGDDRVELRLTKRIEPRPLPRDTDNVKWFELRSEMLSAFYGRDVHHRAGVALPKGYHRAGETRRHWPAIYIIPGFGGRYDDEVDGAADYAMMLEVGDETMLPQAAHIVLDPESPLGHHGFVDSPNHGPRGTALVRELIPFLESKLRLVAKPEARIVTGYSSGGWSSLWLQLQWPDVFGACWSGAPDPVDFSAFQMSDLYRDANIYFDAAGREQPSYRRQRGPNDELVMMTVRQECLMEHAMSPQGASGEQWDAWEAMFSPRNAASGLPRPLFDALTGAIDRDVAMAWQPFDITRIVASDWERFGPIVAGRIRLAVGAKDSFYLHRAVEKFSAMIVQKQAEKRFDGAGYIFIHPTATHGNLNRHILPRWTDEMVRYLRESGLGK
jgi:hypothetical protein